MSVAYYRKGHRRKVLRNREISNRRNYGYAAEFNNVEEKIATEEREHS